MVSAAYIAGRRQGGNLSGAARMQQVLPDGELGWVNTQGYETYSGAIAVGAGAVHVRSRQNFNVRKISEATGGTNWVTAVESYEDIDVDHKGFVYVSGSQGGRTTKLSPDGDIIWENSQASGRAISVDFFGNVYVGAVAPTHRIVKISPDGEIIASVTQPNQVNAIRVSSRGDIYIIRSDRIIRRLDQEFQESWNRQLDGSTSQAAIHLDAWGGVYVACARYSSTSGEGTAYRLNETNGDVEFSIAKNSLNWQVLSGIFPTNDGGFYLGGRETTDGIYFLRKYDQNDVVDWITEIPAADFGSSFSGGAVENLESEKYHAGGIWWPAGYVAAQESDDTLDALGEVGNELSGELSAQEGDDVLLASALYSFYDPPALSLTQVGLDVRLDWEPPLMMEASHMLIFRRQGADRSPFSPILDTPLARIPVTQTQYFDVEPGQASFTYQVIPIYSSLP